MGFARCRGRGRCCRPAFDGVALAVAPAARFYLGDAADRALLDQIFEENQIETIFHFAGSVSVPESISQPLEYYENNTGTTRALVAAAVAHGIRNFIFSSTAAVYGNQPFDGPVPETAILSPENPYGLSKLASEIMLRDVVQAHDFNYVALRYFNVAGADPQGRAGPSPTGVANLIKVACEAATGRRDQVDVYGTDYPTADGTGVRDYIHVSDLIDAHMLAMAHLRAGGGTRTLNCGYGVGYSVLDVLQAVQRESERDFPDHPLSAPRGRYCDDGGGFVAYPVGTGLASPLQRSGDHRSHRASVGGQTSGPAKRQDSAGAAQAGCNRLSGLRLTGHGLS